MTAKGEVKPSRIDSMGDLELFSELSRFFGIERMMTLIGWTIIASCVYKIDSHADVVELIPKLEARGLARSSIYKALADIRKFRNAVDGVEEKRVPRNGYSETLQVVKRLASLSML